MEQVTLAVAYWRSMIMCFAIGLRYIDQRWRRDEKKFFWDHRKEHFGNH